jgi:hypothetical protein
MNDDVDMIALTATAHSSAADEESPHRRGLVLTHVLDTSGHRGSGSHGGGYDHFNMNYVPNPKLAILYETALRGQRCEVIDLASSNLAADDFRCARSRADLVRVAKTLEGRRS